MDLQNKRWFIWTLVFLLVAGVGLVTWIMTTGDNAGDGSWLTHHVKTVTTAKTPVKK